jgi:hypothetical protein
MKTIDSDPDLGIAEPALLQHFRDGLGPESVVFLDPFSEGSFTHLTLSECKDILGKILENTPYIGVFDEFPDKEEEPNTLIEPKPIEEKPIFPTIQSVEDCTPLKKHGSPMNHSNLIEKSITPRVTSSMNTTMSYLINIGRRNPPREGKETQHTKEN